MSPPTTASRPRSSSGACARRCRPTSRSDRQRGALTQTADEINDQIGSFLTPALLAFAGAALLVGAFIIFNTFSITVAQRTREFALLRTLGATRGQILGAVAAEALVIGVAASVLGLLLGLAFAKALGALFDAIGLGLPTAARGAGAADDRPRRWASASA